MDKLYEAKIENQKEEIHANLTPQLVLELIKEIQETWMDLRKKYIKNKLKEMEYEKRD